MVWQEYDFLIIVISGWFEKIFINKTIQYPSQEFCIKGDLGQINLK